MKRRSLLKSAIAALALIQTPAIAQQTYPTDQIRLIVPFGAGGGTDAVARMIAAGLQERLGVPVNVENRPGAGGVIGHGDIAKAATDGSVFGLMTSSLNSYKSLGRADFTYADFTPIALVNFDPAGVQVRADSKFENLQQVVDEVKANPMSLNASASGIGGSWHQAWLQLIIAAGLEPGSVMFIPSEGANASLNELIAGAVDFAPTSTAEARALIEAGDVRALAVMSSERVASFPDVPTVEEAIGVPLEAGVWRGFAGPKGMSQDAVTILQAQIEDIYQSADFQQKMGDLGYGLRWSAGKAFGDFMQTAFDATNVTLEAAGLAQK